MSKLRLSGFPSHTAMTFAGLSWFQALTCNYWAIWLPNPTCLSIAMWISPESAASCHGKAQKREKHEKEDMRERGSQSPRKSKGQGWQEVSVPSLRPGISTGLRGWGRRRQGSPQCQLLSYLKTPIKVLIYMHLSPQGITTDCKPQQNKS